MTSIPRPEENIVELISGFVVECRGRGHFLPYSDHEIIKSWIETAPDTQTLLGVLDEVLPEFYSKHQDKNCPPELKGINRKIKKRLRDVSVFKA